MRTIGSLNLNRESDRSLQAQLTSQLKMMIQRGELPSHQRLPSTRALAEELHISRNTVVAAYEMLLGEGYLQSHLRSGFVVVPAARAFRSRPVRPETRLAATTAPEQPTAPVPFRPTQPDVDLFSLKIWNRHRARALKRATSLMHYQSRFATGLDELRQSVTAYLHDSRGVRCRWEEVAITSGSQQALFLLAHLLLDASKTVYMEDPGYPGARKAWAHTQATVVPVPVDAEGLCLPLPEASGATLVYVTPSHQFPTGTCMSLARRLQLLQLAQERKLWIVEDDYDAEFRYTSPPQPSLQSLDQHRRVIYTGSFSKTLFPGLRIGYVVLPPQWIERFSALKSLADDHGPLIEQATLTSFLESGAFHAHLRRCRRIYAERQAFFLQLVQRNGLPLHFPITGRGMNLAAYLDVAGDDQTWSQRLRTVGLDVPALSTYSIGQASRGLLFGLTAFQANEIERGVRALQQVFRS